MANFVTVLFHLETSVTRPCTTASTKSFELRSLSTFYIIFPSDSFAPSLLRQRQQRAMCCLIPALFSRLVDDSPHRHYDNAPGRPRDPSRPSHNPPAAWRAAGLVAPTNFPAPTASPPKMLQPAAVGTSSTLPRTATTIASTTSSSSSILQRDDTAEPDLALETRTLEAVGMTTSSTAMLAAPPPLQRTDSLAIERAPTREQDEKRE